MVCISNQEVRTRAALELLPATFSCCRYLPLGFFELAVALSWNRRPMLPRRCQLCASIVIAFLNLSAIILMMVGNLRASVGIR